MPVRERLSLNAMVSCIWRPQSAQKWLQMAPNGLKHPLALLHAQWTCQPHESYLILLMLITVFVALAPIRMRQTIHNSPKFHWKQPRFFVSLFILLFCFSAGAPLRLYKLQLVLEHFPFSVSFSRVFVLFFNFFVARQKLLSHSAHKTNTENKKIKKKTTQKRTTY